MMPRLGVQEAWRGPKWEVVAALGGLKGGRADWLVEKATELGAWALQPLLTHRSRTIGRVLFQLQNQVCRMSIEYGIARASFTPPLSSLPHHWPAFVSFIRCLLSAVNLVVALHIFCSLPLFFF